MHEASLVSAMLRQIAQMAAERGGGSVTSVRVEVGCLAGVEPLLLHEAFARLTPGTVAEQAELHMDDVPLNCCCRACGMTFETRSLPLTCPHCGDNHVNVTHGDALVLHSFTLQTRDANP